MKLHLSNYNFSKLFKFALVSLLISSCSSYSEKEIKEFDNTINSHIEKEKLIMDRLENGLYYDIISEGSGEDYIKFTDEVTFIYTGKFLDGEVFQEINENDPLTFKVSQLIAGWQDALSLIKEGGEIKVILPPQLAYGTKNTGAIPPNSILFYKLKVIEVK